MTKPSTSAATSAGENLATVSLPGVTPEVQAFVEIASDGHIKDTKPDYLVWFPAQTNTATREVAEIFNASATLVVRVRGLWVMPTGLAVTGAQIAWDLNKIGTVGTTGLTTVTPRLMDSSASNLGLTGVTCGYNSTAGAALSHLWFNIQHWNEETAAPNAIIGGINQLPQISDRLCEIVLRQNEGLQLKSTTGTVGQTGCLMHFAVDN